MKSKEINTVDLFCGAGGATTGLELALKRLGMKHKGLAINHWQIAVDTMKENHPDVDTKRMSIEEAIPAELVPSGEVDLLWASPSCTHHSRAKGGKPRSNQLRAQPELILTWTDQLHIKRIIVENVPEFVEWTPLTKDGRPMKSLIKDCEMRKNGQLVHVRVGSCFRAWVEALEARNYIVDWRVVNCADYGDATTRRRFFLKAVRRGCGKIVWPEPKYAENPEPDLFGNKKPWRGIRECLDFDDIGTSIFNRKKPLARNTLKRIAAGLKKFCGMDFQIDMLGAGGPDGCRVRSIDKPMATQHCANRTAIVRPFVVRLRNNETAQGVEEPLSTISCSGAHHMLCQPFIFTEQTNNAPRSVDKPIRAQTCVRKDYICQPFIVNNFEHGAPRSVESPVHALTTGNHVMLCQPFVVDHTRNGKARSVNKPIPAQTTKDHVSMITPLILGQHGAASCRPVNEPCPTVATKGAIRMITPLVLGRDACAVCRPADRPMPTLTCGGAMRVIMPFVVDNANGGTLVDQSDPMNTVTTKDNHMGVFPMLEDGRVIDIRIRMLKPSELAAAHSFPSDYVLTGNRGEQVKQIGNSVPVMTAAAMCESDFLQTSKKGA